MKIPLIDLKAQYNSIKDELDKSVLSLLGSTNYIMGNEVVDFEKEFSNYIGIKNAISVGNGTDALVIALKSLGIKDGDEVITSPFTFFASSEAISFIGAKPVFVDVELNTFNIDPNKIEEKITEKTKAIVVIHIFGQPANMDKINEITKRHNLKVIEDACQAIGAEYNGKKIGTLSDIACFSFFPTKNLGCAGDGGMIVTNNDDLATICKALRSHGSGENGLRAYNLLYKENEILDNKDSNDTIYNPLKYYNYIVGHNSRLDAIQAAILRVKLKYIDEWNNKRRETVKRYNDEIKNINVVKPFENLNCKHVYHMYILQSDRRDELVNYLNENGISTGIYYPVPLHLQKVYRNLGYKEGDLPNSEYLSKRTFAIPVYPELSEKLITHIIKTINNFIVR